eukprot:TRINITY_DN38408_c0_g1_i1.p1 TRINITY_DN38408_c0_g1~~TRINITY_DN38408_c0_g1_i1.p1  ORF type:complete len:302 (-),score=36.67 TRINITY_DN38408_c0_g1_i1:35-940(-)
MDQSRPPGGRDLSKWLPVIGVVGVVLFLYIQYVVFHCFRIHSSHNPDTSRRVHDVDRTEEQLLVFHLVMLPFAYCFWKCVTTFPGTIPDGAGWDLDATDAGAGGDAETDPAERKHTGERRHCKWCLKFKPDRCHHCRVCNVCVLRMDHHCPWVYNCIGFRNHKYFILLVFYSAVALSIISRNMFESVWWSTRVDVAIPMMLSLIAAYVLASFLLVLVTAFLTFHIWLTSKAMTTIEFCEKALKNKKYDSSVFRLGLYDDICAVLGPNPLLWLLPIGLPEGDGITWRKAAKDLRRASNVSMM